MSSRIQCLQQSFTNGLAIPLSVKSEQGESPRYEAAVAKMECVLAGKYGPMIGVLVSDSASVYVKARGLLAKKYPQVIFLPCFAHQANLVHVNKDVGIKSMVDLCQKVCTFFSYSHRKGVYLKYSGSSTLPQRMIETRWNSAFTMLKSIVDNSSNISLVPQQISAALIQRFTMDQVPKLKRRPLIFIMHLMKTL